MCIRDSYNGSRNMPRWKDSPLRNFCFVDDNINVEKVDMSKAEAIRLENRDFRVKHAKLTERAFVRTEEEAEAIGMKVNTQKTNLLCMNDAQSYTAKAFFKDKDDNMVQSADTMRILGFTLARKPGVKTHVAELRRRIRSRTWALRDLKKSGFDEDELLHVYTTMMRPVVETNAVVFHSSMSKEQAEQLEKQQIQALKHIYGEQHSARVLMNKSGLDTLAERRTKRCKKFAETCIKNKKFKPVSYTHLTLPTICSV